MAKKKILEITLHDNGRSELFLDMDENNELEVRRIMACIFSLMDARPSFATLVEFCADIYRDDPELIGRAGSGPRSLATARNVQKQDGPKFKRGIFFNKHNKNGIQRTIQ